jgi:hypothetical protein
LGYREPIGPRFSAPNYLLPQQDAENEAIRAQSKQTLLDYSKQIEMLALKSGIVSPTQSVSGTVWFDRSKNPEQLMLRIPVEGTSFEFPLSFKQK